MKRLTVWVTTENLKQLAKLARESNKSRVIRGLIVKAAGGGSQSEKVR